MSSPNSNLLVTLTRETIRVEEALSFITSPYCGAINVFLGTTRINEKDDQDKQVQCLHYEAYEEMALKTITQAIETSLTKLGDDETRKHHRVYVVHRLGAVRLTECSLLIGVSSPHRHTSHQLVIDILNQIKQTAPIWKKVIYDDDRDSNDCFHNWSMKSEAFWLDRPTV